MEPVHRLLPLSVPVFLETVGKTAFNNKKRQAQTDAKTQAK
jgi:hypothetical protein